MPRKKKLTKKQEKYLINKYMATAGGLKPKNIEIELADDAEWAEHQFGGITIRKKK